ncbi:MAG: Bor family protein [Balneolaceae bacterium]|nr:Bor family protein [Balneolaceae bacterium]
MRIYTIAVLTILASLLLTGCYHAQVTTGLEPSAQVYEDTMAHGFLFGLVPPSIVRAQDECTNGVARVETRISFVNGLLSAITLNLYTPMHIKVTCASSSADIPSDRSNMYTINREDSDEVISSTLSKAVEKSLNDNEPFYLDMK